MENKSKNRIYEISLLIRSDIGESVSLEAYKKVTEYIQSQALCIYSSDLEIKDLAYEIRKDIDNKKERFIEAYFAFIKFEAGAEFVKILQEKMDITKEVIRYLLIKTTEEDTLLPKRDKKNQSDLASDSTEEVVEKIAPEPKNIESTEGLKNNSENE